MKLKFMPVRICKINGLLITPISRHAYLSAFLLIYSHQAALILHTSCQIPLPQSRKPYVYRIRVFHSAEYPFQDSVPATGQPDQNRLYSCLLPITSHQIPPDRILWTSPNPKPKTANG